MPSTEDLHRVRVTHRTWTVPSKGGGRDALKNCMQIQCMSLPRWLSGLDVSQYYRPSFKYLLQSVQGQTCLYSSLCIWAYEQEGQTLTGQ